MSGEGGASRKSGQAKRLGSALLRTAARRLHLFSIELREERIRLLQLLVLAVAGCIAGFMALLALLVLIFWLLPVEGRTPYLVVLAAGGALGAFLSFKTLNTRLSDGGFFAATRAELEKDRQCLETES